MKSFETLSHGFNLILESSLYASAMILLLVLLRPWLKHHLAPRGLSFLWFLVIARLLFLEIPSFSLLPGSPLPDAGPAIAQTFSPAFPTSSSGSMPAMSQPADLNWLAALPWIWACGMIVVTVSSLHAFLRWQRVTRHARPVERESLLLLLEECRSDLRLSRPVGLLQIAGDASPCVTGLFRPKLLLSKKHVDELAPAELRWVFLHELAHVKRGDLITQFVCWILQILHWFNPLVWIAFSLGRHDRELACDALVTELENPDSRHHYGQTLLKIAEGCPESPWTPGFLGITEESANLKERLRTLLDRKPVAWGLAGVAVALLVAGIFLLPTRPTAVPAAQTPNASAAADPAAYYHLQFLIVRIDPSSITTFKETLPQGSLEQILALPGVGLLASPETNIGSDTPQVLSSSERIYLWSDARQQGHDCGWNMQFLTASAKNKLLREGMHLDLSFQGSGLMYNGRKETSQPGFSNVAFPFNGIIPLKTYHLLGTTNLSTGSAPGNALLAFVVKAELNAAPGQP
jgi:bla regulator protein BlaR1